MTMKSLRTSFRKSCKTSRVTIVCKQRLTARKETTTKTYWMRSRRSRKGEMIRWMKWSGLLRNRSNFIGKS